MSAKYAPAVTHVPGLDPGIEPAVRVLRAAGVPTYESCEGGVGHSFSAPTVRFRGNMAEGFAALATAMNAEASIGLGVRELRRVWRLDDGEPTGPWWDLVFRPAPNSDYTSDGLRSPRPGSRPRCCFLRCSGHCRDRRFDHSVALSGTVAPSPSGFSSFGQRGRDRIVRAAVDRLSTISRAVLRFHRSRIGYRSASLDGVHGLSSKAAISSAVQT